MFLSVRWNQETQVWVTMNRKKIFYTQLLTGQRKSRKLSSPHHLFSDTEQTCLYWKPCATKQHWCATHNFPKIESGLTYSSSSVLLVLLALVFILPVVSWASLLKLLWVTLVVSVLSESFISAQSYFEIQTKEHWCISFV